MNKWILTGSSGFLGYHLQEALKRGENEIITIPHKYLAEPDILKYKLRNGFDYLVHAASYGNYYDQTDKDKIWGSNVAYTQNLLEVIADIPYKGFMYISTSSVYGKKDKPMKEDDICEPITDYAKYKLEAERECLKYKDKKPIIIFRPFTMYGYRDNPKHLIPTVIRSIKDDVSFNLDPYPVHDYIYIKDVINAILYFKDLGKEKSGQILNLGTGFQYSNKDIVDGLELILDKKAYIHEVESIRTYDSNMWVADTSLVQSLGFKPKYNLMEGLWEAVYEEKRN